MPTIWAIDRDYLDGDRIGYGQILTDAKNTQESFDAVIGRTVFLTTGLSVSDIKPERRVRFKLLDDDGEVYYGGACDVRALEITDDGWEDDLAYNIERWGEADSGAIHCLFKRSDIAKHAPAFAERHPSAERFSSDPDWILIYG